MQSQTAYELATQGLIKPADSKIPIIYSIKSVDFKPPEFTIGKYLNMTTDHGVAGLIPGTSTI